MESVSSPFCLVLQSLIIVRFERTVEESYVLEYIVFEKRIYIMGKIDTITKEYMENPVVFADAFNQFLYHGARRLTLPG